MYKKFWSIVLIVVLLFVVSAACNLPFGLFGGGSDSGSEPQVVVVPNGEQPQQEAKPNILKKAPDPNPVTFQNALGSFDSYKFRVHITVSDSQGNSTDTDIVTESSVVDGNNHTTTTASTVSPDSSENSTDTQETYNLGNITCSYSDGEWSYSEVNTQDKEIRDIFSQMIDFVPVINDPKFVGEEEVNGVKTNHFTFKVSGIGEKSGSVATVNQGDYWLAQDGNYIVKYMLNLQVQSAPSGSSGAEVSNLAISYSLYDVNVPVPLSQPAGCYDTGEDD